MRGTDQVCYTITILVNAVAVAYGEGKKEAGKEAIKNAEKAVKDAAKKAEDEKIAKELKVEVAAAEEMVEKKEVKDAEKVV